MPPPASRASKLATCIHMRQENPKRKGSKSHQRYEGYKAANFVKEFLALGGSRACLLLYTTLYTLRTHDIDKTTCHTSVLLL